MFYLLNENKHFNTLGTFPKINRKIVERDKFDTPNTQMHDLLLSWLSTGT
jgi:hypothetical protein